MFAEFKEKEKAESFLKLPSITFKGKELLKESKSGEEIFVDMVCHFYFYF